MLYNNEIVQKYLNKLDEIQLDKKIKTTYPTKNIRSINNIDINSAYKGLIKNIKWKKTIEASGWGISI